MIMWFDLLHSFLLGLHESGGELGTDPCSICGGKEIDINLVTHAFKCGYNYKQGCYSQA